MNRGVREVIRDFKAAGLEIEVVEKRRHLFVMFEGEQVYKLSKNGRLPTYAQSERASIIRGLLENRGRNINRD